MFKYYALIGLFLYFVLLLFAVIRNNKNENAYDFFFAERKLPFWALSITFVASWWGAGSAISTADLAYEEGISAFFYYGFPVVVSTVMMILFAKAIRRIDFLTQGEMMQARYSSAAAKLVSFMNLIFMILNAASQMVGIGMFFGYYLELNYLPSVLLGTVIVLIYSYFGGFKAVVFTDIIQFVLLTISAICVFYISFNQADGFTGIAAAAANFNKVDYLSISKGLTQHFMYIITFGCAWMIQANVWQRISAAKDTTSAASMAILALLIFVPLYLIAALTGMAGLAIFPTMPESGIIAAIIKDFMSPALGAVIFVGISAAIMSTTDSLINTGAMTLVLDIFAIDPEHKNTLLYSRLATLFVALIALLISLEIRSILTIAWIAADVITIGVFIPLIFGFIWKRGNNKAALSSMIWSLVFCGYNFLIEIGLDLPCLWEHGGISQILFGVGVSLTLYIGISILTKPDYEKSIAYIQKAGLVKD